MKSFNEFVTLSESVVTTTAGLLRLYARATTAGEKDNARGMIAKFALKLHKPFDMDNPASYQWVLDQADQEEREEKRKRQSHPDFRDASMHPSDQFNLDIRLAAQKNGFEASQSSHYIINIGSEGYLGMIFFHKKYRRIKLSVPLQFHYKKVGEFKPFWILKHEDLSHANDNLGKGDTVATFESAFRHLDLEKIDQDAKAAKQERDRPKHAASTHQQITMAAVLAKHGFTLEPPSGSNQTYQYWNSADRKTRVYSPDSGNWDVSTNVAGTMKSVFRRSSKPRTVADLEAYLNKAASGGAPEEKAHAHPEMDKIIKHLVHIGFHKVSMQNPSSTQFYENTGVGILVEVGRVNFMAKGRITKNEEIYWSMRPARKTGTAGTFARESGQDFASLKVALEKVATFTHGPEAITKLVHDYGFVPIDISAVADKFRDPSFKWFLCGTKKLSSGTPVTYYLGYHPATGEYTYYDHLDTHFSLVKEGKDIDTLKARLALDGFKPGQNHAKDEQAERDQDAVATLVSAAIDGGMSMSSTGTDKTVTMVHNTNHLYILNITKHAPIMWTLLVIHPGLVNAHEKVEEGRTAADLKETLAHHIGHVKTLPESLIEVKLATGFHFKLNMETAKYGEDFVMTHPDTSVLEISKATAGWEHFWKKKVVGQGMSANDLKTHLTEMYQ